MDDLHEQKTLIMESAALGASIALNRLGLIKDEISQREAYRIYGESCVRTWLNRGWVHRVKPGTGNSKVTYSRIELDTVKRLVELGKLRELKSDGRAKCKKRTYVFPVGLRPIPRPEIKTADASLAKRRTGRLPRLAL
ncbi:hypothetical protein [Alistipes putredinis]